MKTVTSAKRSADGSHGAQWIVIGCTVLLLMTALVSCERHIESKDPVRSLPDEPPVPINVRAQMIDRAVHLSWEISDSSNVARFRIYRADEGEDDYTLQDSSTTYAADVSGLPLNQPLDLQVRAVSPNGVEGDGSEAVTVTIGLLSITIADNDEYTNNRNVQVQLNAPATAEYVELSEDPTFAGTSPVTFAAQRSFTLSAAEGTKTVYARFTFDNGSVSGDTISDDITLDTYAQIRSVSFAPTAQTFTTGDTITFFVDADSEADGEAFISFPGVNNLRLNDAGTGGDVTADDGIYTARYVVPVGMTVNSGEVLGDFTDAAGNDALQASAGEALDIKTPPVAVQLTSVEAVSNWQLTLRWTESISDDFSVYRVFRSENDSVSDSSLLVASIAQSGETEYTDTTVDASTEYFYIVYVIDNSGLRAASNVDSALTPANTSPRAVTAAASLQEENLARLTWTRNDDDDFASYRVYRDTSPNVSVADDLISIVSDRNSLTYDDYVPFPNGDETYYYRVMVYDRQGLTASSNEVEVSR